MNAVLVDFPSDTERLYDEYVRLSALGNLPAFGEVPPDRLITGSVSACLIEGERNAIVG